MILEPKPGQIPGMDASPSSGPSCFGATRALSVAPAALAWMAHTHRPRFLHIFKGACNLINEHGTILSIVSAAIGNGPFNLVVADPYPSFKVDCDATAPIAVDREQLIVCGTSLSIRGAGVWFPTPDWQRLHMRRARIRAQLLDLQAWLQERANIESLLAAAAFPLSDKSASTRDLLKAWINPLGTAVANADLETAFAISGRVAGLGTGLTPAGDDLLLGAIYAAWVIHPSKRARALAGTMAKAAFPRTTSLSAAWLRAGSRGEASTLWHDFLHALLNAEPAVLRESALKMLAVGQTSGADALAGFVGALICCSSA